MEWPADFAKIVVFVVLHHMLIESGEHDVVCHTCNRTHEEEGLLLGLRRCARSLPTFGWSKPHYWTQRHLFLERCYCSAGCPHPPLHKICFSFELLKSNLFTPLQLKAMYVRICGDRSATLKTETHYLVKSRITVMARSRPFQLKNKSNISLILLIMHILIPGEVFEI